MTIKKSDLFARDIAKLKINLDIQIQKTIDLLKSNTKHLSLQTKHIVCKKADNLFSVRVNKQYRIMFFDYGEYYELYRLLEHDKYDRLTKDC